MFLLMVLWAVVSTMLTFLLSLNSPFMASLALAATSLAVGMALAQAKFSWMFFTVTILFVGGMMVLFMYICSLSASLKAESNTAALTGVFVALLVVGGMSMGGLSIYGPSLGQNLSSAYAGSNVALLSYLVLYLLLGLIVAMQVANKFEGPLKNKFADGN